MQKLLFVTRRVQQSLKVSQKACHEFVGVIWRGSFQSYFAIERKGVTDTLYICEPHDNNTFTWEIASFVSMGLYWIEFCESDERCFVMPHKQPIHTEILGKKMQCNKIDALKIMSVVYATYDFWVLLIPAFAY